MVDCEMRGRIRPTPLHRPVERSMSALARVKNHLKSSRNRMMKIGGRKSTSDRDEFQALCTCVREGDLVKAQQIYRGSDVNRPMAAWDPRTPLQFAVANSNVDMVRFLLDQCKADPSIVDARRRNSLHLAVLEGNEAIVGLLIANGGAGLRSTDQVGQNVLHLAAQTCNVKLAQLILEHCPDPDCLTMRQSDGKTPIDLALMHHDHRMASFLTKAAEQMGVYPPASARPKDLFIKDAAGSTDDQRPQVAPSVSSGDSAVSQSNTGVPPVDPVVVDAVPDKPRRIRQMGVIKQTLHKLQSHHEVEAGVIASRACREGLMADPEPVPLIEAATTTAANQLPIQHSNQQLWDIMARFKKEAEGEVMALESRIACVDMKKPIAELDNVIRISREKLDERCRMSNEEIEMNLRQLCEPERLEAIHSEIIAIQDSNPQSSDYANLAKAISELNVAVDGGRYPPGALNSDVLKETVAVLRQVCESDRISIIDELAKNSTALNLECAILESRLDALKIEGKIAMIRESEAENEKMFRAALESSKRVIVNCDDEKFDGETGERLRTIKQALRTTVGGSRSAIQRQNDAVQEEADIFYGNVSSGKTLLSSTLDQLDKKDEGLQTSLGQCETARTEIANQIEQLLQAERDRQRATNTVLIEKMENDVARRQIKTALKELENMTSLKLTNLDVLARVYKESLVALDGMEKTSQVAIDTTSDIWARHKAHIDHIRQEQYRIFSENCRKHIERMKECIGQEETILGDIEEEIEFHIKSRDRAAQKGRNISLNERIAESREERARVVERCAAMKQELDHIRKLFSECLG